MPRSPRVAALRALPPDEAWREICAASEPELVATWLELFRRSFDLAAYADAREHAAQAAAGLGGMSVGEWLATRGVTLDTSARPSTFGTATVRAWYDERTSRVVVFSSSLDAVLRALRLCGSGVGETQVRDAIAAHEAFHALHPRCPGRLAEMAAHLFAGSVSGLGRFAGVIDVVHALSARWPEG